MKNLKLFFKSQFELLFLAYLLSFFLTLGTDHTPQVFLRMVWGGILIGASFILFGKRSGEGSFKNVASLLFVTFFVFELIRSLWAGWGLRTAPEGLDYLIHRQRLVSPLKWFFYLGFFNLSYSFFSEKKKLYHLFWLLAWAAFFLALNGIPPLLRETHHAGYENPHGGYVFFWPPLYFSKSVSDYVLGWVYQSNYTGDIVALGFFAAFAIFLYAFQMACEKNRYSEEERKYLSATTLGMPPLFVGTIALATLLFNSRGTILSFALTLVLYFLSLLLKFRSKSQLFISGLAAVFIFGFFAWAGNPAGTLKELQTIQEETDPHTQKSFIANVEGAQRAVAIYRAYPIWGVGTDGYEKVSEHFATEKSRQATERRGAYQLAQFKAMSHYLQILAEEGLGAFLYGLFLIAYAWILISRLICVKSRFQFIAALSLAAPVFLILVHASFGFLMQQFSVSMLVYSLMGASLGALRRDFVHS